MAISIAASGTQTATIGTEHTLSGGNLLGPKTFTLMVDTTNMVAGDELQLRIKTKTLSGGTETLAYMCTIVGAQDIPQKISIPIPVPNSATFTLKQTAGTGRAFPWNVCTPD